MKALPTLVQSSWRDIGTIMPDTMAAGKFGKEPKLRAVDLEINISQQRTSTINCPAGIENDRGEHLHGATTGQNLHNLVSEANIREAADEEGHIPGDRIRPDPRDESLICSICTEEVHKSQDVRVLPCEHTYHRSCIDPWVLNFGGNCPLW
jgi:hypothetical protein